MAMFPLSNAVLLMSVGTGDMVSNADFVKERTKFLVLATLVGLHSYYFAIKLALNKRLKTTKTIKNFRFVFNKVDPHILAEIINE